MPAKDNSAVTPAVLHHHVASTTTNIGDKFSEPSSAVLLPSSVVDKTNDAETKLIRRDVDHLVQNIKDNLKLGFDCHQQAVNCEWLKTSVKLPGSDYPAATWQPAAHVTGGGSVRKARSYLSCRSSRASPYSIPGSAKCGDCCDGVSGSGKDRHRHSWAARKRYPSMSANGPVNTKQQKQSLELDDPLEMLQELISEGNLLKEAVRRLQQGLSPKIQNRNFYDSDDDGGCRSPPPPPPHYTEICHLGIN